MKPICPKCKVELEFEDDSFSYGEGHHGPAGTEIIRYWVCPKCEKTFDEDEFIEDLK